MPLKSEHNIMSKLQFLRIQNTPKYINIENVWFTFDTHEPNLQKHSILFPSPFQSWAK